MMIRSGSLNAGDKIVYGYRYRKDFQRGEDIMYKKGICRHIVPILTALTTTMPPAGTIVTYNDGTTWIAEGGSLSHPNNIGMELIAKRVVAQLKLG